MLLVETTLGPSPLHGIGLFAAQRIPKGALVWRYDPSLDRKVSAVALTGLSEAARRQVLHYAYRSKESGVYVLCGDDARFFNHSDTPNVTDDPSEEGEVISARDIEVGEELVCDYGTFDADDHEKLRMHRRTPICPSYPTA